MVLRLLTGVAIGVAAGALMGYFGKCSSGACPLTANPYRGAIYGGVLGVLFTLSMGGTPKLPEGEQLAVHIDSVEAFEQQVLNSERPSLVDFYSDRCGPCRKLAPTIEALARTYEGRAQIYKVDVDAMPQLAGKYRISSIPAVIVFGDGSEVQRLVGLRPQEEYAAVLDQMDRQ